jgi:membrane fusion protein
MSWRVLTGFLALVAASAVTFVIMAGYARKETAMGVLAPTSGAVRVIPARAGRVAELKVAEGDQVEAGQILLTLDSRQMLQEGGTLEASLTEAMGRQTQFLRERIAAEETQAATEDARLKALLAGTGTELAALRAERSLQAERIALAGERLDILRRLRADGHVAKAEQRAQEEVWLSQRQALVALDRQIAAAEAAQAEARAQRDQLAPQTAAKLAELRSLLTEVEQRQTEITAQGGEVVRAPIAGRVAALQTTVGGTVDPSRPVLTLMPKGSELRAELYVASRAIGFVSIGQRVRLMYDAFPFQRFGTYGGVVESVSGSVFTAQDATGSFAIQEPSYKVVARLDRQDVDAFGQAVQLQPDMTVTADILLEERSILEWLLEPLLSARGRM